MSRVRSAGAGVENTLARLREGTAAPTRHVRKRANELSGIAKHLHRNAPRGGRNLNMFGERRSAPGEVPAMETGSLYAEIDQGVEVKPMEATVIVNRTELEFGSDKRNIKPRPLGAIAAAEFRQRTK